MSSKYSLYQFVFCNLTTKVTGQEIGEEELPDRGEYMVPTNLELEVLIIIQHVTTNGCKGGSHIDEITDDR